MSLPKPEPREVLQICVNNAERTHIGWVNSYFLDEEFHYSEIFTGKTAIGISIPPLSARRKGYAAEAWLLFIDYLRANGAGDIYTQTWSGNERLLGLAKKTGFTECNRYKGIREVRGETYDALTLILTK